MSKRKKSAPKKPETIRVKITHSAHFYKAGEKYTVFKEVQWGSFEVSTTREFTLIDIRHAKQIPCR